MRICPECGAEMCQVDGYDTMWRCNNCNYYYGDE